MEQVMDTGRRGGFCCDCHTKRNNALGGITDQHTHSDVLSADSRNHTEPLVFGGPWSRKRHRLVELLVKHIELARRLLRDVQEQSVACQPLCTAIAVHLNNKKHQASDGEHAIERCVKGCKQKRSGGKASRRRHTHTSPQAGHTGTQPAPVPWSVRHRCRALGAPGAG